MKMISCLNVGPPLHSPAVYTNHVSNFGYSYPVRHPAMSLLGADKRQCGHENKKQDVPSASESIKAEKRLARDEVDTGGKRLAKT